ncbi:hypothetical protein CUU66_21630 [Peribacillus deserti]|uniref:Integral membrane bound transporter domain-containing protein n=1 Tax=Peribacillus deserti TaxID=673318 RepID=A0A2N5M0K9_9BACI|nr:hypothetical protein CUU66_21630 [Peribacillus deserti]
MLCLQSTYHKTVRLSIKRVTGTIIGISFTVIISTHMIINGWNLGLLVLLGGFITKWLKFDKTVLHQVALTILFVFVFEHQKNHYVIDRMRDTLIGVMVAVLIQLVWFRLILPSKQKIS